jgi:hypothetical protein
VAGRCTGPAWGITRHHRLRPQGALWRDARRVLRRPGPSMTRHPAARHQGLPDAVPGSRTRDALQVSGPAALPGPGVGGARGRSRHDRGGGREWLALHPRASQGMTRARGWRFVHGGIPITRAAPGEVPVVWTTTSRGRAGAVASVAHTQAVPRGTPAHPARQATAGPRRRDVMAPPRGLIPVWVASSGDHHRERPRPHRPWPRAPHRHDAPRMSPALRRITVGRAPAITLASRAAAVEARACGHRVIASQEPWARRDARVPHTRAHQASEPPG